MNNIRGLYMRNRPLIQEAAFHLLLYWGALAAAFNAYKGLRKGYTHFASYVGETAAGYLKGYLPAVPISKTLRGEMAATIPVIVVIFMTVYVICRLFMKEPSAPLTRRKWMSVLCLHSLAASFSYYLVGYEMLVVALLSIPVFVVFLLIVAHASAPASILLRRAGDALRSLNHWRSRAALPFLSAHSYAIAGVILAFYLVALSLQLNGMSSNVLLRMAVIFALQAAGYFVIQRSIVKTNAAIGITVLITYSVCSLLLFYNSIWNIFSADYWLIFTLFTSMDKFDFETFRKIAFFEMFGDARFQPLAHLTMYARHLIFGGNVLLYNLFNVVLHSLTAFAVYLVVNEASKDKLLAFMTGSVFIVLATHFDTVRWTYHIYIILGTLSVLFAVFLLLRYAVSGGIVALVSAFVLALISMLLYEAAALAPFFMMALILASMMDRDNPVNVKKLWLPCIAMIAAYLLYAAVTVYGLAIKEPSPMTLTNVMLWHPHLFEDAGKALITNMAQTSFMKNIGVIMIRPDGTVTLPSFTFPMVLFYAGCLLSGALLLPLMKLNQARKYTVMVLSLLALSYVYVIYVGRAITNDLDYMVTQQRYQYFANALFAVSVALLLARSHGKKELRFIITCIVAVVFLWNIQAVSAHLGGESWDVGFNKHYYRISNFTDEHAGSKVFVDFIPNESGRLDEMYSDISLDLLLHGRVTRFMTKAAYVYDGDTFKKNSLFGARAANLLGRDFTVAWRYATAIGHTQKKVMNIVGSDKLYPRVSMTPDKLVQLIVLDAASGMPVIYEFKHSYLAEDVLPIGRFMPMSIVKHGDLLCFFSDDRLVDKRKISFPYRDWNSDGRELIGVGGFYTGAGELVFNAGLFIQIDVARYECS